MTSSIKLAAACLLIGLSCIPVKAQEPTRDNYQKTGNADFDDAVHRFVNNLAPKIVGGRDATSGAYPWQVSLGVSNIVDAGRAHFCGGTIYNERWIVTAAHCVKDLKAAQIKIVVGTYKLNKDVKRYSPKRLIAHRSYVASTQDKDVALIELEQPLKFDQQTKPISVLDPSDEPAVLLPGVHLMVTGWGAIEEGGDVVRDLREVEVPFVSKKDCSDPLSYGKQITDNMVCAGIAEGGKDSCQGDSGGPLTSISSPTRLVGIVSWGDGCARPGKYGVYTRVSNFKSWIENCVAGGSCP